MNNKLRFYIYDDNLNEQIYLNILKNIASDFIVDNGNFYEMGAAGPHNTHRVYEKVVSMLQDRFFGNNRLRRWLSKSPDLTPLDFYVLGNIKPIIYQTSMNTKAEL